MKRRALPILGVAGLALLSVTAPAHADADFKFCHKGQVQYTDLNGVHGHSGHTEDIIPPNSILPGGLNWTAQGIAEYNNSCIHVALPPVVVPPKDGEQPPVDEQPPVEEQPPVKEEPPAEEQPPAVVPETPVTPTPPTVPETPTTLTPAAQTPAGQAAAPQVAVAKIPAAAVSRGTNQGFNAQTSVGSVGGTVGSTTWLAGLGLLLGAGAVVSVRRKSRTESPTAG
jgi:hypothetical protein